MEKAIRLARPEGMVSMIVPTGWYSGKKFSRLRRHFACTTNPERFINLPYDVFEAWIDTTVFVTSKRAQATGWPRTETHVVQLRTFPKRHRIQHATEFESDLRLADFTQWFSGTADEYLTYSDLKSTSLIRKMLAVGKPLGEIADVQRGVTPFELTEVPKHKSSRPAFDGTLRRYVLEKGPTRYIRFDETLAEPKPERYFLGSRILLRELISRQFRLQAVKVTRDFITNKSVQTILAIPDGPDLHYLLGVVNSRLMSWFFLQRSNIGQRDDFPKIVLRETRSLPISISADAAKQKRMGQLVERMRSLQDSLRAAKSPHDQASLQSQIAATDRQIDRLVYDLYGLTNDEVRIVEGAGQE